MEQAFPFTANHSRAGHRRSAHARQPWDQERKSRLTELWLDPRRIPAEEIADEMEVSVQAIYQRVHKLGLPPRRKRGQRKGPVPSARDGQRRHIGVTPKEVGDHRVKLEPWHPSLRLGTTTFPTRVFPAVQVERLLKSGEHNRKIGTTAERGPWKGMEIFTLTLVERETCPASCLQWATCYGNTMHAAPRILPDRWFEHRLEAELAHLNAAHPRGFIVRLHVLGDFYSTEYVAFWVRALGAFPGLHIFGFTARLPSDPIGRAVLEMMAANLERVAMRVSGGGERLHCSEVVKRREDAIGVICPAEVSEQVCCASCMVCVRSERTISFIQHG